MYACKFMQGHLLGFAVHRCSTIWASGSRRASDLPSAAGLALVTFAYQQHAQNCLEDHHVPLGRRACGCCRSRRRGAPLLKGQHLHVTRSGSAAARFLLPLRSNTDTPNMA